MRESEIQDEKKALRQRFLLIRKSIPTDVCAEKSAQICERIVGLSCFQQASVVMVYQSLPGEVDLSYLIAQPASREKRFVYPVCLDRQRMIAMIPGAWRAGAFGIREPDPECSMEAAPSKIDLVICPGVAFDRKCSRLGMGGGYYDRFLPACPQAAIIMAAFEEQRAERIPREETDAIMQQIVTDSTIYQGSTD